MPYEHKSIKNKYQWRKSFKVIHIENIKSMMICVREKARIKNGTRLP